MTRQNSRASLTAWNYISNIHNPYVAPECATVKLSGIVWGHKKNPDGERVLTSEVVRVWRDPMKPATVAITYSGSEYELKTPMSGVTLDEVLGVFSKVARARALSGHPLTLQV